MDSNTRLKLLWRTWYVKAVAAVVVVALLAGVGYVALTPTYTADEVTERMETYLRGKIFLQSYPKYSLQYDYDGRPELKESLFGRRTITCAQQVRLATPHYIPYRKAWRITTVYSPNYTWLFDERTGTIASSDARC